ncbi:hypothetical protein [Aliiroseovarius sp. xm-v-208]|uniref:hypothetical protein n=2 Tax=Aliiroseovarius TaxID=1658781 RepID=UPI001567C916|nr:hypothetical protein [Aliiroseovarius sp. xm-v-208]
MKMLEDAHKEEGFGAHSDTASSYFFASITASVASLEATYNALIEDLGLQDMEELIDRKPLLQRYGWLLKFKNKQSFRLGNGPAQSVKKLLDIRNAAVHYRPRWDDDPKESQKLEEQFRGLALPTSPLFPAHMPFFPYRCCSYAYAEWGIQTVEKFLADFEQRIGVKIPWLASPVT